MSAGRTPVGEGVLIEITAIGNVAKVCAIDTRSGTEVSITVPAATARADMEKAALRKLQYVLAKKSAD